jgi:transposase
MTICSLWRVMQHITTSTIQQTEFIDSILINRTATRATPIIMSDALTHNKSTVLAAVIEALCNSHARRQFVDVISHFPEEIEHILERYGKIWTNEHKTTDLGLTPGERLAYHKEHSLPIMAEIYLKNS